VERTTVEGAGHPEMVDRHVRRGHTVGVALYQQIITIKLYFLGESLLF